LVKTPFCVFDLKTGVPCPKCQALIDEGKYTYLDFEVAKALLKVEESGLGKLKEVSFEGSFEVSGTLVVIVRGLGIRDRLLLHRLEGELAKEFKGKYRKVKVIERSSNLKELISQLVYPIRVTSVNIYWYPDGSSEYTVGVSKGRLPLPKDLVEEIAKRIVGREVKIITS